MEPEKRPARRRRSITVEENPLTSLKISKVADTQLSASAKKFKIGKGEYASAAIAYFAERGLNPTVEQPQGLADIGKRVSQEGRAIRVQNVDIGNRLISILRNWEKSLYGFLQQQQGGTLNYLEQIESDILRHQVSVETNFLAPMVEMLAKTNVEANTGRALGERTNLRVMGKEQTDWPAFNKALNDDRDQKVVAQMREFIKTNNVAAPSLAAKPQVPVLPPKAPATQKAATPGAAAPPQ